MRCQIVSIIFLFHSCASFLLFHAPGQLSSDLTLHYVATYSQEGGNTVLVMPGSEDDASGPGAAALPGEEESQPPAVRTEGEGASEALSSNGTGHKGGDVHEEEGRGKEEMGGPNGKERHGDRDEDEEEVASKEKRRERRRHSSRSRSRSPRGGSRGSRRDKRRSRSRSESPRGDRRRRSRDREGKSSRRSRRSASGSRSLSPPSSRRRRRRERANNWDKPPEGLTVGQGAVTATLQGLGGLGLSGSGAGQFMDPPMLDPGVMMGTAALGAGGVVRGAIGTLTAPTAPPNQQELFNGVMVPTMMLRQAKRLYVGNVPMGCDQFVLMQLFNQAMVAAGKGSATAPPIVGVQVNESKPFAFLETRTPEDAANVLLFDGITIGANQLKVRRPKDFKPLPGIVDPPTGVSLIPGHLPTSVENTENKIYLGSIPTHFNDLQVRELVSAFGNLKAFNLVKDPALGTSKGFCFFEYLDHALTDRVCAELNGFELGERKLICQRANPSPAPAAAPSMAALAGGSMHPYAALLTGSSAAAAPLGPATKVLKLSNMVVAEELRDDNEYEEIVMDIKEECGKYGQVVSLKVPRPSYKEDGSVDVSPPGVGEVFVEFADEDGATKAGNALRNRQFSGRTVVCEFVKEEDYAGGNL